VPFGQFEYAGVSAYPHDRWAEHSVSGSPERSYDCVDRIVLNAYFRMGHSPGGFFGLVRALTGSDETLENAYLRRMAGVSAVAFAAMPKRTYCGHRLFGGERKHDIATEYRSKTTVVAGLISGLGWSSAGAGLGCQRQTPTSNERRRSRTSTTTRFISWTPNGVISPSKSAGISLPGPGDLERHDTSPAKPARRIGSPRREIVLLISRRRRLGEDRRHLVRTTG